MSGGGTDNGNGNGNGNNSGGGSKPVTQLPATGVGSNGGGSEMALIALLGGVGVAGAATMLRRRSVGASL